jgi:hypothetical protein
MIDGDYILVYIEGLKQQNLRISEQLRQIRQFQTKNWDNLSDDAKDCIQQVLEKLKVTCARRKTQPAIDFRA